MLSPLSIFERNKFGYVIKIVLFLLLCFQCDVTIPLEVNNSIPLQSRLDAIQTYLSPELLDKIRLYVTLIPSVEYELSEDMSKVCRITSAVI